MKLPAWKIKFTLLFILLVSSVSAFGVGIYLFFNISNIIKDRIFSEVNSTAESKAEVLETYLSGFEYEAQILSDVLAVTLAKDSPNMPEITDLLSSVASRATEIAHIDLISPKGIVIASSDQAKIGGDKNQKPIFLEGKSGLFFNNLHVSSGGNKPAFGVSVPIESSDHELLGVVLVDVNADKLYDILNYGSNVGDLGEAFLVNRDNLLVSPSKYISDSFLQKELTTENIKTCSTHKHSSHSRDAYNSLSLYNGLSGKPVIGTHVYMPKREWCLVAEVDKNKFLSEPIRWLMLLSGVSTLLSLSLFYFAVFVIYKIIISPIRQLTKVLNNMSTGHIDTEIDPALLKPNNEIGELARSFDRMVISLKLAMREKSAAEPQSSTPKVPTK